MFSSKTPIYVDRNDDDPLLDVVRRTIVKEN